jgi:hypothetical protein
MDSHFEHKQMLHRLVDIDADGYGDYLGQLEQRKELFSAGTFFIIVTPQTDKHLFEMLRWAKSRQMMPYHIHIGRTTRNKDSRTRPGSDYSRQGIDGITVSDLRDLPALLGGVSS